MVSRELMLIDPLMVQYKSKLEEYNFTTEKALAVLEEKDVDDMASTTFSGSWKRDLTRECVEPNPGPVWDDVRKRIETNTSPSKVDRWKGLFNKFEEELDKQFPDVLGYTIDQVKILLNDSRVMEHTFGPNANVAREMIKDNILAFQALPQGPPITAPKPWVFGRPAKDCYRIEPLHLQLPDMIRKTLQGGFFLVQGGFRTGKTTHLLALHAYLKNATRDGRAYTPIIFTFTVDVKLNFWPWVTSELQAALVIPETSAQITSWELLRQALIGKPNVVLLFDEAQVITQMPMQTEFLQNLKRMADRSGTTDHVVELVATGAFGTFSSNGFSTQGLVGSPFPAENVILMQNLSFEQVDSLFQEWAKACNVTIDQGVTNEIHATSQGYPGFVGFTGIQLDNKIQSSGPVTMDMWLELRKDLSALLLNQDQFKRIVMPANAKVYNYLQELIYRPEPISTYTEEQKSMCVTLADHGVLTLYDNMGCAAIGWYFTAPIVRELVFRALLVDRPPGEVTRVHLLQGPKLFLKTIMSQINSAIITRPEVFNITTGFQCEQVFQGEMFRILYGLIKDGYYVLMGNKIQGNVRANIVFGIGEKVIYELKSHWDFSDPALLEHVIEQIMKYIKSIKATYGIIVNFHPSTWHQTPYCKRVVDNISLHIFQVAVTTQGECKCLWDNI